MEGYLKVRTMGNGYREPYQDCDKGRHANSKGVSGHANGLTDRT